jgi:hypothetical protein
MRLILFAVLVGLFQWSSAFAEPHFSVVLIADHILDVQTGKLIDHQALLVSDGVIAKIGPLGKLDLPRGTNHHLSSWRNASSGSH